MEKNKVTIIGYFGYGNIGDEAILESMLHTFKKELSKVDITVLSDNYEFVEAQYKIKSSSRSLRNNFREVIKIIRESQLIILGGGGFLFDYYLLNLPMWLVYILIAKIYRRKVMIYAMGIGPINTRLGKAISKFCLNKVDVISLRDNGSKVLLHNLKVNKPHIVVTADPALIAPYKKDEKYNNLLKHDSLINRKVVGISVRSWPSTRDFKYVIAGFADILASKFNYNIVFIPMHYPQDLLISKEITDLMSNESITISQKITPEKMYNIISRMDLIIGMRLHSLIFAAKANVPMIGIIYDPKVENFLKEIQQDDYSINVNDVTCEKLVNLTKDVICNRETIRKSLKSKVDILGDKALNTVFLVLELLS